MHLRRAASVTLLPFQSHTLGMLGEFNCCLSQEDQHVECVLNVNFLEALKWIVVITCFPFYLFCGFSGKDTKCGPRSEASISRSTAQNSPDWAQGSPSTQSSEWRVCFIPPSDVFLHHLLPLSIPLFDQCDRTIMTARFRGAESWLCCLFVPPSGPSLSPPFLLT